MVAELQAQILLRKTKNSSIITVLNVLLDTLICIVTFFMISFVEQTLLISLGLSFILGIICIVRYNGFQKFFKSINQNEVSNKTLTTLKGYEKLFDRNSLIFSALDFVTTIIIIVTLGVYAQQTVSVVIGLIFKTTILTIRIGNNAIQFGKLIRALRIIALISGTYAVARNKKFMKGGKNFMDAMRNVFKWIWANKKSLSGTISTILISVFGILEGTNSVNIMEQFPAIVISGINITPFIAYSLLGTLCLLGIFGKGYESIKAFFTRIGLIKEIKIEAKAEAEINKLAEEQLKIENEKRKEEIIAQLKLEKAKKEMTVEVVSDAVIEVNKTPIDK